MAESQSRGAPPTRHSDRIIKEPVKCHLRAVPELDSRQGSTLDKNELPDLTGYDSDDDLKMVFSSDKENKNIVEEITLSVEQKKTQADRRKMEFLERSAQINQRIQHLKGRGGEITTSLDLKDIT